MLGYVQIRGSKFGLVAQTGSVPLSQRLRFGIYATCPGLLAPAFALKRLAARRAQ